MATAVRAVHNSLRGIAERYQKLEDLRRRQRQELEARLRELREASQPSETVESNDIEALSDNASNTGVGAAVVEITSRTLQGIEGALRRLQEGRYGECADCGGGISAARLRALPFAERCRDCQQLADGGSVILAG